MNQTDIVNAAAEAAKKSKSIIGQQVDRRTTELGSTLSQTARDLEQVGTNLRSNGTIGSAAQLADWAAGYVNNAAEYLTNGDTDRFIVDVENFARDRPWAIAASAAAVGFIASRIIKSSSARRYQESAYGNEYDADYSAYSPAGRYSPMTSSNTTGL